MGRAQASVASPAANVGALLRLDTAGVDTADVSIGAQAALVGVQYDVYACLDTTSVVASANLYKLLDNWLVPPATTPTFPPQLSTWPILMFVPTTTVVGNILGSGSLSSLTASPVSTALPAANAFLGAPLGPFLGPQTLLMLNRSATAADYVDIYPCEDAGATTANACNAPIRLYGGGGANSFLRLNTQYAQVKSISIPTATAILWSSNCGGGAGGGGGGLPVPVAIPATPLTIAERNAAGGLQATSFTGAGIGVDAATLVGSVTGGSQTTVQGGSAGTFMLGANVFVGSTTSTTSTFVDSSSAIGIGAQGTGVTVTIGNSDNTVLMNASTAGFTYVGAGVGNFNVQPGPSGKLRVLPRAAGAGNVGQLVWVELAASGTNHVGFQAPDALAGDTIYVLPTAFPTIANQELRSSTAGVMQWWGNTIVAARTSNAQVIVNNAVAADVTTWVEGSDTSNSFNATTGQFLCPVTGIYMVNGAIQFAATAATIGALYRATIALNGTAFVTGQRTNPVDTLAQTVQVPVGPYPVAANAGDIITLQAALSGAGGNIALTNQAAFNWLSIALQ